MRGRHVPVRTCVACRSAGDKRSLLRVVRAPDGCVSYDVSGKANGRGSYVCASVECIALARKKGSFARALRCSVPDSLFDALVLAARAIEDTKTASSSDIHPDQT